VPLLDFFGFAFLGFIDLWSIHIPIPLALAVVAMIGYLVGRRKHVDESPVAVQSRRELRRAQLVARELENISLLVRGHLSKHHSCLGKFKQRVGELSGLADETAWKELCQEAEQMLKPTLQLATQIANAYDEIRQQSNLLMTFTEVRTDPLTGVSNRRALNDTLASQLAMMVRYESSFTLALFDIDHFKKTNDQQGHMEGDRILQRVAALLDESARETDTVTRFGGEEFVIVMPETDLEGACLFADRVRQRVEDDLPVTISGGVTAALDGDTAESILARADTALYDAKNAGRNCIFRHNGQKAESFATDVPASSV
jgi:diguanylate cyclase (GGDEF)-like protein